MTMFCYQCQETDGGTGCTQCGVCGKSQKTAALQDVLTGWAKQIAQKRLEYRARGINSRVVDNFLLQTLYMTMTNVNFDDMELARSIFVASNVMWLADSLAASGDPAHQKELEKAASEPVRELAEEDVNELVAQGEGFLLPLDELGAPAAGLLEMTLYGIRGAAAFSYHFYEPVYRMVTALREKVEEQKAQAKKLKSRDRAQKIQKDEILKDVAETEEFIASWESREQELMDGLFKELAALNAEQLGTTEDLLAAALHVGDLSLKAMSLLEEFHSRVLGKQEPQPVCFTPHKGKCILVSGHNLLDLEELLRQTRFTGVNVYTHGEMLSAHSYPKLKAYPQLVGNYGTSWFRQRKEFSAFPGAILMTTNCMQQPEEDYKDYIFTTGPVGWPGVKRITEGADGKKDFTPLIEAAKNSPGFRDGGHAIKTPVGYGNYIFGNTGKIAGLVESGSLRRIFIIAGCDGRHESRGYFTELADLVPKDCAIMTFGCGKYRLNDVNYGFLSNAFPRFWDMGQCNDAILAIRFIQELARVSNRTIDNLPISIFLSWYEQKAVAVFLALLSLNIKNIHIGPTLPAFVPPEVAAILVERYGISLVSNPQADLEAELAR